MSEQTFQQAAVTVLADLPLTQAWQQLQDLSLAHNYVPGLTRTEIVSDQRQGVGAHRRVYTGSKYLEETVIDWREGAGFTIKLHKGEKPMAPFRRAEFVYALSEGGDEQTRIDLALRFQLPLGGVGRWLGKKAILPVMVKQLTQVAAGMKHFYETGQPATDEDRARLAGAVQLPPASA